MQKREKKQRGIPNGSALILLKNTKGGLLCLMLKSSVRERVEGFI